MADLKTRKTRASPNRFLEAIADEGKRKDSLAVRPAFTSSGSTTLTRKCSSR